MIRFRISILSRKRKPIPYMSRPDVKAALEQQGLARSKHARGGNAVYDLTHDLLRREMKAGHGC